MKKPKVIIGKQGSGKTRLARQMAEENGNAVRIFTRDEIGFYNDPFLFRACKENTKMVVFDEICNPIQLRIALELASRPVEVHCPGKYPFEISPAFVIVCSSRITIEVIEGSMGEEFTNKIELIQL